MNAGWSAARLERARSPDGLRIVPAALRCLERHLARGCQPVCYAVNSFKERQVRLLHVPLTTVFLALIRDADTTTGGSVV